jgi:hypothetical protein
LFEQQQQQPRKRAEEKDEGGARERETEENAASNEPPELAITQVTDDGLEKTVSIEDMLSKAAAGAGAGGAAQAGAGDAAGGAGFAAAAAGDASLRAKLDETNALLKALADVNKKILETDREVLMRLKARETQAAAQATQSK